MKKKNIYNILFCGIGGQGVLTASEICGYAAIFDGYNVKKSEVHGMAQRGGSVESHLRFGENVYSPLIPEGKVDYLVPFYKDENERMKHLLNEEGIDLVSNLINAENKISDVKLINTYLLGVLSKYLPLTEDSWIKAINAILTKMQDKNINIFLLGRNENDME